MDRNTGRGPPERNRQRRPWRSWELWRPWRCRKLRRPWQVQGAQEAMADGPSGCGLGPLGPATPPRVLLPPPQNFPGVVRGYQEPSGARQTGTGQSTLE